MWPPDFGIKSCPKSGHITFYLKSDNYQIAPKVKKIFWLILLKNCCKILSKIAQSSWLAFYLQKKINCCCNVEKLIRAKHRQLSLQSLEMISRNLNYFAKIRKEHQMQRDQIWGKIHRTLAKFNKSLGIFEVPFSIWQKFEPAWEFFNDVGKIYTVVDG